MSWHPPQCPRPSLAPAGRRVAGTSMGRRQVSLTLTRREGTHPNWMAAWLPWGCQSRTSHEATDWGPSACLSQALRIPVSTQRVHPGLQWNTVPHTPLRTCGRPRTRGRRDTCDRSVSRHKRGSGCLGPRAAGTRVRWRHRRPGRPVGSGAALTVQLEDLHAGTDRPCGAGHLPGCLPSDVRTAGQLWGGPLPRSGCFQ